MTRYVYDFDEPSEGGRDLLGGKGIGLAEIYDELEQAKKLHRKLRCPVIDISELSIEETAHRILRVVEERAGEAKAQAAR